MAHMVLTNPKFASILWYPIKSGHVHGCITMVTSSSSWTFSTFNDFNAQITWDHLNNPFNLGYQTWGRGWMTKASGVGERREEVSCGGTVIIVSRHCSSQPGCNNDIWYMIYNNDIYGGGGRGGPFAWKSTWCPWGAPEYLLKQEDSSELTLAFVIMPIIANNYKM